MGQLESNSKAFELIWGGGDLHNQQKEKEKCHSGLDSAEMAQLARALTNERPRAKICNGPSPTAAGCGSGKKTTGLATDCTGPLGSECIKRKRSAAAGIRSWDLLLATADAYHYAALGISTENRAHAS